VVTLGAYAAGMATLMLAVTGLAALGKAGAIRALAGETGRITRAAGALLVLAGIAQIYLYAVGFDALAPFR
jgi:cytochrome c-type biogenesis protein